MDQYNLILDNLLQELRRGSLVLLVLSHMHKQQYGYSLLQEMTDKGISVEAGTLYPLMRRLEKQGLLDSKWDLEVGRPRKYYILSEEGKNVYSRMKEEWFRLVTQVTKVMEND